MRKDAPAIHEAAPPDPFSSFGPDALCSQSGSDGMTDPGQPSQQEQSDLVQRLRECGGL